MSKKKNKRAAQPSGWEMFFTWLGILLILASIVAEVVWLFISTLFVLVLGGVFLMLGVLCFVYVGKQSEKKALGGRRNRPASNAAKAELDPVG